jgi:hypothetical protein
MGLILKSLIALLLGFTAFAASADSEEIHIQNPWVRAAPPTVKILAGYFSLTNNSEQSRKIIAVSSPVFKQIEIHRSVMHGDMAHMEHQKELAIPPHAVVTFEPGELHLMLMDANKPLHIGDTVPMTLRFQNGKKVEFDATVRSGQMENMDETPRMKHSEHMHQ